MRGAAHRRARRHRSAPDQHVRCGSAVHQERRAAPRARLRPLPRPPRGTTTTRTPHRHPNPSPSPSPSLNTKPNQVNPNHARTAAGTPRVGRTSPSASRSCARWSPRWAAERPGSEQGPASSPERTPEVARRERRDRSRRGTSRTTEYRANDVREVAGGTGTQPSGSGEDRALPVLELDADACALA